MSKFIMMIGLPSSGKSMYAQALAQSKNAIIHSSDNLREELFGNINECSKNDELFKELHRRIKQDLSEGKNVIYDATNLSLKKRRAFLQEIKKYNCFTECYLVATPYEKCLEYNRERDRIAPEHVIKKMYKNIYIPQEYEGWQKVNIIWNYNEDNFRPSELYDKLNILHNNPHHSLNIYEHCAKCYHSLQSNDKYLKMAALYHDIGKPFCKEFKNGKNEDTEIAHYYQHHLVSAYDSLFYLKTINKYQDNEILKTVNYIQHHMQPFFMESDKSIRKFINLVGQEFYDNLLILHQADKDAH